MVLLNPLLTSYRIKVLFLGATGYIGASIVDGLSKHTRADCFDIVMFARHSERRRQIEEAGYKAVCGGPSALEKEASEADAIINCVPFEVEIMNAILAGAKRRFERTRIHPILIHTSGAGILLDNACGQSTDRIYDDAIDGECLNSLPGDMWNHRRADIMVTKAHQEGYVKAYIVLSPLIYGKPTGRLVDAGLVKTTVPASVAVLVKSAIARGKLGIFGPQLNIWCAVELSDLADLYILLLDRGLLGYQDADERSRYFFASSEEIMVADYLRITAQALYDFGALGTAETSEYTQEELEKKDDLLVSMWPYGSNTRMVASRAREAGWRPVYITLDFLDRLRGYVEVLVKQQRELQIPDWL